LMSTTPSLRLLSSTMPTPSDSKHNEKGISKHNEKGMPPPQV
jgi:hypothetical protein